MKQGPLTIALCLVATFAFGDPTHPHVDFNVTDVSTIQVDGESVVGDAAIEAKMMELAKRNPKPDIYLRSSPDVARKVGMYFGHLYEEAEKFGLKLLLVGHEAPQ